MTVQCGNNCRKQRKIYEWVKRIKRWQTNVRDDACSGQAQTVTSGEVKEQIDQHILNN
jgi:hypothetical protein